MKQLCYDILLSLLDGPAHGRTLAARLGTNQMSVHRALQTLAASNAVTYRQEGRNKVYRLQHSLEAHALLCAAEHERFRRFVERHPELRLTLAELRRVRTPTLIFGSYAKGTEKPTSDIDVYTETKGQGIKKLLATLDTRLSVHAGILSRTSPLWHTIRKNHVLVTGVETFVTAFLTDDGANH